MCSLFMMRRAVDSCLTMMFNNLSGTVLILTAAVNTSGSVARFSKRWASEISL
jgi:hypothetical protein